MTANTIPYFTLLERLGNALNGAREQALAIEGHDEIDGILAEIDEAKIHLQTLFDNPPAIRTNWDEFWQYGGAGLKGNDLENFQRFAAELQDSLLNNGYFDIAKQTLAFMLVMDVTPV